MGDLTQNFSEWEFRCHCDICMGHVDCRGVLDRYLVECLQLVRDILGVPIHVHSGYRCVWHVETIRNPESQHARGRAADWHAEGKTLRAIYQAALQVPGFEQGGIGQYPTWNNPGLHTDVRGYRARWMGQ